MNFNYKFIDEQTALISSLYDLTAARKSTEAVQCLTAHVEAFNEITHRICAAPRLALPHLEGPITLYTDASKIAVGAVFLVLNVTGVERIISFVSKKLSSAQKNYSIFERKCLAIVCALEHFSVCLLARPFRLFTDHCALQLLFSKKFKASARISGWLATLMKYVMQIEYVRGCENVIADALPRIDAVAIDAKVPAELARGVPSNACPAADADGLKASTDLAAQQRADTTISRVVQLLNVNAGPDADALDANSTLKSFVDAWSQVVVENALLKHCNELAIFTRSVVPAVLREEVVRALHEPAHHGYQATLRCIDQRVW